VEGTGTQSNPTPPHRPPPTPAPAGPSPLSLCSPARVADAGRGAIEGKEAGAHVEPAEEPLPTKVREASKSLLLSPVHAALNAIQKAQPEPQEPEPAKASAVKEGQRRARRGANWRRARDPNKKKSDPTSPLRQKKKQKATRRAEPKTCQVRGSPPQKEPSQSQG